MRKKIPVSEPRINKKKAGKYLLDCLKTEWVSSSGKYLDKFESEWSKYCNRKYSVCVSSGTAALQVAFKSIDIKPGDEVILPSFTIISCIIAIIEAGAIPVLVDCEKDTWCMKVDEVIKKINSKTKAILLVHMFGHPVDMNPILKFIKNKPIFLIEDAAESHGAQYRGKIIGSFGDISCFSFYSNKLITTGEGGMVLTNNKELDLKIRSIKNLYFNSKRRFSHDEIGYNYRMTNLQAALGLSQLESLENHLQIKRKNTELYNETIEGKKLPLRLPIEKKWAKNSFWMYGIVIEDKKFNAVYLAKKLLENKIETRPLFLGMHEQPVFKKMNFFSKESYKNTEELSEYGLYLPSGLRLNKAKIIYICKILEKIFNGK